MMSLTIAAALALAPQQISTPPEYAKCLDEAMAEAARDDDDLDEAVPRAVAACDRVWASFEQRILERFPGGADTLAKMKSRMRAQVRELYPDKARTIQELDYYRDTAEFLRKTESTRIMKQDRMQLLDCQIDAAEAAVEEGVAADDIAERVGNACAREKQDYEASLAPFWEDQIAPMIEEYRDAPTGERPPTKEEFVAEMMAKTDDSYASLVERARRKERCVSETGDAAACALADKARQAHKAVTACLRQAAVTVAMSDVPVEEAVQRIEGKCSGRIAVLQSISRSGGFSEAQLAQEQEKMRESLRQQYPAILKRVRTANGAGA